MTLPVSLGEASPQDRKHCRSKKGLGTGRTWKGDDETEERWREEGGSCLLCRCSGLNERDAASVGNTQEITVHLKHCVHHVAL